MAEPIFKRLCLIGIGLIGSSIALRARRDGLAKTIVVQTRRKETLDKAKARNLGDVYTDSIAEAVKDADCVILCVPVGAFAQVGKRMNGHLADDAIVTDVGSVKRSVINQLKPHIPSKVHLVPGHPIAGTEYSGPEAGFATLFDQRWCLLTPEPNTDKAAVEKLTRFWKALGSLVDVMDPDHHDRVLAVVSHIPHLIAYNIVGTASDLEEITESEVIKYLGRGLSRFHPYRRLGPGDVARRVPAQQEAVLEMLGRFSRRPLRPATRHPLGRW